LNNIERGASSLNSVSIDYFLYQEDLQLSMAIRPFVPSIDLETLKPGNEQQQHGNNVAGDHNPTLFFDDVVNYL
jgi:hypothetical protein